MIVRDGGFLRLTGWAAAAVVCLCMAGEAAADDRRLYIGAAGSLELLKVGYDKTTDGSRSASKSTSGSVLSDADSANGVSQGLGGLVGYRLPLASNGLYLAGEVDVLFHGRKTRGQLSGVPGGPGRLHEYADSWPDRWAMVKDFSYGLTLKLGGQPSLLRSYLGKNTSLYALAGIRRVRTRFSLQFRGCNDKNPRPGGGPCNEIKANSSSRVREFFGWTAGAGIETMLQDNVGLRLETRYVGYGRKNWTSVVPPEPYLLSLPASLTLDEANVSVQLVRYF